MYFVVDSEVAEKNVHAVPGKMRSSSSLENAMQFTGEPMLALARGLVLVLIIKTGLSGGETISIEVSSLMCLGGDEPPPGVFQVALFQAGMLIQQLPYRSFCLSSWFCVRRFGEKNISANLDVCRFAASDLETLSERPCCTQAKKDFKYIYTCSTSRVPGASTRRKSPRGSTAAPVNGAGGNNDDGDDGDDDDGGGGDDDDERQQTTATTPVVT